MAARKRPQRLPRRLLPRHLLHRLLNLLPRKWSLNPLLMQPLPSKALRVMPQLLWKALLVRLPPLWKAPLPMQLPPLTVLLLPQVMRSMPLPSRRSNSRRPRRSKLQSSPGEAATEPGSARRRVFFA